MTRAACVAFGAFLGLSAGWILWGGDAPVVETPAPAIAQPDGSLVLERAPDPGAKPAHRIPAGTTLERTVTVIVQPEPVAPSRDSTLPISPGKSGSGKVECECAPVHVDLSLVREPNGMRRVVASARGGTILGGVDIPVESAREARVLRWGAGLARDVMTGRYGGTVSREFDRLLFLPLPHELQVTHIPGPRGGITIAAVEIRF